SREEGGYFGYLTDERRGGSGWIGGQVCHGSLTRDTNVGRRHGSAPRRYARRSSQRRPSAANARAGSRAMAGRLSSTNEERRPRSPGSSASSARSVAESSCVNARSHPSSRCTRAPRASGPNKLFPQSVSSIASPPG